jgi:YD repeat-containing protein
LTLTRHYASTVFTVALVAAAIPALGETVTYHSSSGQTVIRASVPSYPSGSIRFEKPSGQTCLQVSPGGSGTFYYRDSTGKTVGSQTTTGNTTYFYDPSGMSLGKATRTGNTVYYYDSGGRLLGREELFGSTAYFENPAGTTLFRTSPLRTPEPTKTSSSSSALGSSSAKQTPVPTPIFAPKFFLEKACDSKQR